MKTIETAVDEFQELLDLEGIKYFSADEVFYLGGSNGRLKLNTEPPKELWPNIIPTLRALDAIRKEVGPLTLTSIYRSPAYNKALSGTASNSYHMQFKACDVIPLNVTVKKLHSVATKLRNGGLFKGGIGKYSGFVHVDTRGYNADW